MVQNEILHKFSLFLFFFKLKYHTLFYIRVTVRATYWYEKMSEKTPYDYSILVPYINGSQTYDR